MAEDLAISAKTQEHIFDEYVKNNDLSEDTYNERLKELNDKLNIEKNYYDLINNNPNK